ncbi:DUF4164 domain-containing protein [Methylobacterium nodulans]|uniref:DUF4164 family protein n=1 Tax=Methylobacterium nodulans (strain LMG 21967 / CNCM I-2342 / ORS 2060) TaxID=460265 RepID=B8ILQ1_METNO|nr:DUF4164 domain-containing protein [Methylobacterium nodulans]ACL62026.1 conserved hypothetical protein [Methylobacterium nodulans ORS 2060]
MSAAMEDALRRLEAAVALLDAGVTRRLDAERSRGDLEAELALMQEDRARLAAELDGALAQLAEAVAVTDDVEHRLGRAIGAVEGVLGRSRADG